MPELQNLEKPADLATKEKTTNRNSKTIKLGVASVALASVTAFGMAAPASAETVGGTYGQGLSLRAETNTASAKLDTISEGEHLDPQCFKEGQDVLGDNIWHKVNHNGQTGFVSDHYLYGDTPDQTRYYPTPAELEADGVPRCSELNSSQSSHKDTKHLPCTPLLFVGARGSGNPYGEDGLDGTLRPLANSLKSKYGNELAIHGLRYQAVDIFKPMNNIANGRYDTRVDVGKRILKSLLKNQIESCSNQKFILAGYSQGGDLVGDTLSELKENILNNKIAAVALFGDANFNPNSQTAQGDFNKNLHGFFGSRAEYPESIRNKVRSYCKLGDGACNANPLNIIGLAFTSSAHKHYFSDGEVKEASSFIQSTIQFEENLNYA